MFHPGEIEFKRLYVLAITTDPFFLDIDGVFD
jgi:hypothetical protein